MNYETNEIKTQNLIMKRGKKEDYMKVYEYDYSDLNIESSEEENYIFKK